MSELIVREITPRDRPASYGNVDLGVKENQSRGSAKATVVRDIPGTQFRVCLTFLADSYHNRAYILEKSKTSKNSMEVMVRGDDGVVTPLLPAWLDEVFGDIHEHAAKLAPSLPPGYSADPFDAPDHLEDGTPDPDILTVALDAGRNPEKALPKEKPQPGPKTAAKGKKGQTAPMPTAGEEEFHIRGLADFLALPMRSQMLALGAGMPMELLQEIATSDSPALEMDVKNEAFKRLSE